MGLGLNLLLSSYRESWCLSYKVKCVGFWRGVNTAQLCQFKLCGPKFISDASVCDAPTRCKSQQHLRSIYAIARASATRCIR